MRKLAVFVFVILATVLNAQERWKPLGPDGGDVRSLAADPQTPGRVLLGTSAGQIYESLDNGASWSRFVHLGERNDYVLDTIIFAPNQPKVVYVAAWSVENNGGDLFRSDDGGKSWSQMKEMKGKSIRAFAMAPSNEKTLVVGALDGVFRSNDGGEHWTRISPENNAEIRNIESIAIDPKNPDIVYAGTWHLPWKTSDGGATWKNIKNGMIDDSDVFSIIVDPVNPSVVYVSACSGIYKSENGADQFRKIQGIPATARRTRVLMQDPAHTNVVYAGTTEGLWKTTDSGHTWLRMTGANIIVNDVLIDSGSPNHVLLATDRSGVLASNNSALSFVASNRGFAHRQVATLLVDKNDSQSIYAGIINDKEFGGVFATHDGGSSWQQMSQGIGGLDIFTLRQTSKGELLAGTNRGILEYKGAKWTPINDVLNVVETTRVAKKKKAKPIVTRKIIKSVLNARVNQIDLTPAKWYAATTAGIYMSNDEGRSWHGGPQTGESDFVAVHAAQAMVLAASRKALLISMDSGNQWTSIVLPKEITAITDVTTDDSSNIFLAAREGAYRSSDGGATWEHLRRLPVNDLASVLYDAESHRLITTSNTSTKMFESMDAGRTWHESESGWLLRNVRPTNGRVIATTAFDGIVVQPDALPKAAQAGASAANPGRP